jgi:hypothetical protein
VLQEKVQAGRLSEHWTGAHRDIDGEYQTARESPEKSRTIRIMRLNANSSTLWNITMPSVVPATRAGILMAKSIKTFDDKLLRKLGLSAETWSRILRQSP